MKVTLPNADLLAFEPSIWFDRKKGKKALMDKQTDKDQYVKFDVPVNRIDENDEDTIEWSIRVFENGDAEDRTTAVGVSPLLSWLRRMAGRPWTLSSQSYRQSYVARPASVLTAVSIAWKRRRKGETVANRKKKPS